MRQTFIKRRQNGIINKIKYICKYCDLTFYDWFSNQRKYCSRSCSAKTSYKDKLGKINYNSLKGDKNHAWKGDRISYSGIHEWLRTHFTKPDKCAYCGGNAGRIEWANISKKYKRNIKDFIALCSSCHKKYDGLVVNNPSYHTIYMRNYRKEHSG